MKEWAIDDPLFCISSMPMHKREGEETRNMAKGKQAGGNTAAVCRKLGEPIAAELGVTLWDVRFVKEGASWYLRYFIDKPEGATLDDCVALSRRLNPMLDEVDPIPQAYCLEVSTPGVERELTRPEHFAYCEGWAVVVRLFHAVDGEREFAGILQGLADGVITLTAEDGTPLTFAKTEVASVHVIDEPDEPDESDEEE